MTSVSAIMPYAMRAGTEVLLPAIKECILAVDMEQRMMRVHIMDGLLE